MIKTESCIIVHGCPSKKEEAMNFATRTYDKHWIPWTREKLNELGVPTVVPLMPDPWEPNYEKFKEEFERQKVSEDTTLIGHSCGCAFLVRWLGDTKQKINKLILVAPWKIAREDNESRKAFYGFTIDETIKERVGEIVMFTSDDEEDKGKESLKIYKQALGGEIIELKKHGHYTIGDMGTDEFPELIEQAVKFDHRKALILPINQDKKVFIQDRRGYKKPDWGYFGEEIEKDETPLEAVIRESKEELDINITEKDLKYVGTFISSYDGKKIIKYMFLYPTEQKEFRVLEGKGGHWFTFTEARERLENADQFEKVINEIQ